DNVAGGRMATEHLVKLGYRRIATIASQQNPAGDDRYLGYRQVLEAYGIPFDESLVAFGDYTLDSGYNAMQQLMPAQPDAVFAASDMMALGAMRAVEEAHLIVPYDVAVVGYDDLPPAVQTRPALTTVRQPIEKLGNLAVEMLIENIQDKGKALAPRQIILPCELVVRASTGAAQP
ncbi:MAG: LacI family DNA-binding transcriptional regulator, partial [Phototrophicaceae bacterium]